MDWLLENISILPFLLGLVLCVAGWTLYWGGLNLIGAIVGTAFGLSIAGIVLMIFLPPKEYGPFHIFVLPIAAVVGLYLGTRFFRALHKIFFFFIGALVGAWLGTVAMGNLLTLDITSVFSSAPRFIVIAVVALICGVGMVWLSRYCIVAITSLAGTFFLLQSIHKSEAQIFFIPIFLTSVVIQTGFVQTLGLGLERKPDKKEEDEKE